MCGICGKFNFQNGDRISPELIEKMCQQIIHRGPDDQGIYARDQIGIGMRRLSIIDVDGGHQPIHNEDKTVWVVCNGEIYNFKDLRSELEQRGHIFSSHTDTEVIVHAYEEYGVEFFKRLRGMFAIAVWDSTRKRLILGRDRVGKKPLFYTVAKGALLFGSEMKSILQDPTVERRINSHALDLYLTHQCVPSPLTMFEGIYKVPIASMLICEKGTIKTERYWDLEPSVEEGLTEEDYSSKLLTLLKEAVRLRMISDVPLGAFLSGGIDSSIVVALMAEESSMPIKTFSIGFEEEEFSEVQYARMIADRFGTDHQELIVTPNISDLIPKLVWHYNEPFADSSAIPTFYLSQMTRESVTVALSGDGGDELFAGYQKYIALEKISEDPWIVAKAKSAINKKLSGLGRGLPSQDGLYRRAIRSLRVRTMSFQQRNDYWGTTFDDSLKSVLYSESLKDTLTSPNGYTTPNVKAACAGPNDRLGEVLTSDFTHYLPDDLLVKVDVASMANSLEVRCPFLDHVLVEFIMKIPTTLKLNQGVMKYLLKKTFSGILPEEILGRPKTGFAIPLDKWLREELRDWSHEVILDQEMGEYFKLDVLENLLNSHSRSSQGNKIWTLLMFSLWNKMFLKNYCMV